MVVFTCNHCGDSLQKPRVEKHYQFTCRTQKSLTCVDCLKDFMGEDYVAHTKCMTEVERYAAKGSTPKINKKGEVKQESWIEMVKSIVHHEPSLPPNYKNILSSIAAHNNVPRKKGKFINFIKSCSSGRVPLEDIEATWNIIEKHKLERQTKESTTDNNTSKGAVHESVDKDTCNGADERINGEVPTKRKLENVENAEDIPKKKKKNKNKNAKSNDGTDTANAVPVDEGNVDGTGGEVAKKKKRKGVREKSEEIKVVEELTNNSVSNTNCEEIQANGIQTEKTKKKRKTIETEVEPIDVNINGIDIELSKNKKRKSKDKNQEGNNDIKILSNIVLSNDSINGVTELNDNETTVSKKKKKNQTTEDVDAKTNNSVSNISSEETQANNIQTEVIKKKKRKTIETELEHITEDVKTSGIDVEVSKKKKRKSKNKNEEGNNSIKVENIVLSNESINGETELNDNETTVSKKKKKNQTTEDIDAKTNNSVSNISNEETQANNIQTEGIKKKKGKPIETELEPITEDVNTSGIDAEVSKKKKKSKNKNEESNDIKVENIVLANKSINGEMELNDNEPIVSKKKKKIQATENTDANAELEIVKESQIENVLESEIVESPKKKGKKLKHDQENQNNNSVTLESENTQNQKKKTKKREGSVQETQNKIDTLETENTENPKKKGKKHKEQNQIENNELENGTTPTDVSNKEASVENGKKKNKKNKQSDLSEISNVQQSLQHKQSTLFEEIVLHILNTEGDIPLKKLEKKVATAYTERSSDPLCSEKIKKKFVNKLKNISGLEICNDFVKLIVN